MNIRTFYAQALAISVVGILVWIWGIAPYLNKLPFDFSYQAHVISSDNFYNEQTQEYEGEQRSVTKFSHRVVAVKKDILMIYNIFKVQKVTGEHIFSVERLYAIDRTTRRHVAGFGDRNREGYLFAPQHLKKGEPFTYWHINYDGPAHMQFVAEEYIHNLPVYKYETRYEGVTIDQTKDLTFLPQVGVTRGVQLEPHLEIWVEPMTGRIVKYTDDTIAYFYDLETGKRLSPWNHFHNTYTPESIAEQVRIAFKEKVFMIVIETVIPVGIIFMFACIASYLFLPKKTTLRIAIGFVCVLFLMSVGIWRRVSQQNTSTVHTPFIPINVGMLPLPGVGPLFIATENKYFAAQGLEVHTRLFDSGKAALNAMFEDPELQIVVVAQTPIVNASFSHNDFAIIAGLSRSNNDSKILIRNDKHIRSAEDLRGKRIGVTKGTTGHYFLGLFLEQYNLTLNDVQLVDIPASSLVDAIRKDQVDVISTWEPYIFNAQQALVSNASILPSENTFRTDYYLVSPKDWIAQNPDTIQRFLQAVEDANTFIINNPQQSADIIADRTKLERSFIESVFNDYVYRLFIDQAILLSLEQQARWMIANKLTPAKSMPNYLDFIYTSALRMIESLAVTIIE